MEDREAFKKDSYNQRQLLFMRKKGHDYIIGNLPLKKLVDDLKGSFHYLENVDDSWKKTFYIALEELEEMSSFLMYNEKKSSNNQEKIRMTHLIDGILHLVYFEQNEEF